MENAIRNLVDSYIQWLKEGLAAVEIEGEGETYEITTPFLDRHNDHLQIFIRLENGKVILTDGGYTLTDLAISGFELTSSKRLELLNSVLNGFGIKMDGDSLVVETNEKHFGKKKHDLLQAMLAINDFFYISRPMVRTLFKEDVERYLESLEVRYTRDIKFPGKSGFDHFFDFVIPPSKTRPERILKAINRPTKDNATSLIFAWTDTQVNRPEGSIAIAALNDTDIEISPSVIDAFSSYEIKPLTWSRRSDYHDLLLN